MIENDNKKHVGMRISRDGLILLDGLKKKLGLDRTAVVELAIRRLADTENVLLPQQPLPLDLPDSK